MTELSSKPIGLARSYKVKVCAAPARSWLYAHARMTVHEISSRHGVQLPGQTTVMAPSFQVDWSMTGIMLKVIAVEIFEFPTWSSKRFYRGYFSRRGRNCQVNCEPRGSVGWARIFRASSITVNGVRPYAEAASPSRIFYVGIGDQARSRCLAPLELTCSPDLSWSLFDLKLISRKLC